MQKRPGSGDERPDGWMNGWMDGREAAPPVTAGGAGCAACVDWTNERGCPGFSG